MAGAVYPKQGVSGDNIEIEVCIIALYRAFLYKKGPTANSLLTHAEDEKYFYLGVGKVYGFVL